jgi:SnoaL-like protein
MAWKDGDWTSVDWADPEIEYVIADGPAPGRWTGLGGLEEGWRNILSAWDNFRIEADEYRQLDTERVLVLHRWSGRGKTSGVELGQISAKGAGLFHIRNGKVMRAVTYFNRERALADVGLTPEAGSRRS